MFIPTLEGIFINLTHVMNFHVGTTQTGTYIFARLAHPQPGVTNVVRVAQVFENEDPIMALANFVRELQAPTVHYPA